MAHNTRKLVGVILMLSLLVAALAAFTITASAAEDGTWTLVTDAGDLAAGDQIVIVASGYNFALGTTQNTNNRASASVTKSGDKKTVTFGDDVQIITLETGKVSGTFAFKVGTAGYLYAASSSKNYLKSKTTLDNNGSWSIEITTAGIATIKAQGTNTRNWLRYNSSNNPPLFSCYSSGQADVCIYKFVKTVSTCDHSSLNCGDTCSVCNKVVDHVYENACDTNCNNCGEVREITHTYTGAFDTDCDVCGATREVVIPTDPTDIVNLLYTLSSGEAFPTAVTLKGEVVSIDTEYSASYGNITVTINVFDSEGKIIEGKPVKCYRMVGDGVDKINVGDIITVNGILTNYNGTKEFNADCQMTAREATGCTHENTTTTTIDSTCTVEGSITVTCDDCEAVVSTENIATIPHNYVEGVCSVCEKKEPGVVGKYYIAAIRTSGNYQYMTGDLGTASTKRYQLVDSGLTTLPSSITEFVAIQVFVLVDNGDNTYSIYADGVEENNYLGWTSGNSGTLVAEADALKLTMEKNDDGTYTFHFTASDAERYLALNGTTGNDYFAFYKSGQKQNLSLVPVVEACQHENQTTTTVDPTCTEAGSTTVTCDDCEEVLSTEEIAVIDHSYDTAELVVVENVPFVSYKCACGDKKVKNVATFRGASIRYKGGASVEQLAIRFGYQFDPNVIDCIVGWSWDYEAIDGNAVISGTVDGTAITAAGVSNLVFTDIPTKRIDGTFKVTLTLVLEIDGTEYTYTEAEANVRVISNVLTAIKDDTTETQEARDYAQDVLDAFEALPDDDEPAVMPSNEENEN